MRSPEDRFEAHQAPEPTPLDDALARQHPVGAFALLAGGDAFEGPPSGLAAEGPAAAEDYARSLAFVLGRGTPPGARERVSAQIVALLSGNPALARRLARAKPLAIDLVPPRVALSSLGYPRSTREVIGLFWDQPQWPRARMALRCEHLCDEPQLVVHETAHAVYCLAFTRTERELIHRVLARTWGTPAAVAEVFAIYSERAFLEDFREHDRRAPGVYGLARRRWHEDHVFARFIQLLYRPQGLAGRLR